MFTAAQVIMIHIDRLIILNTPKHSSPATLMIFVHAGHHTRPLTHLPCHTHSFFHATHTHTSSVHDTHTDTLTHSVVTTRRPLLARVSVCMTDPSQPVRPRHTVRCAKILRANVTCTDYHHHCHHHQQEKQQQQQQKSTEHASRLLSSFTDPTATTAKLCRPDRPLHSALFRPTHNLIV